MEEDNVVLQESYLLEIFDIAKYAASIEDAKSYRKATDMLVDGMFSYVRKQMDLKETYQRGLVFTETYIELMNQIFGMICKQEDNFFAHDTWLISVWYNPTHYVPLSEDFLSYIWRYVLNVIDADKEDWFMSYWTYADQYFRFYIEDNVEIRNNPLFQRQKKLLKQMHLGIGAYMLYKQKSSLVRKILNFTQTMPASYSLLDNTFSQIIDDMSRIYELMEHPLLLTKKYMMSGLMNDVNSDSYVAGKFNAYFALLMVRLSELNYNVSYCEPYQMPYIKDDSDIATLQEQIKYVNILKHFLSDIEFRKALSNVGYSEKQKNRALGTLGRYLRELETKIKNIEKHPQTDQAKVIYIKKNLIQEIHSQKLYLPVKEDSALSVDIAVDEYYSGQTWEISKEDIALYMDRLSANLEEALISYMLMQESQFYNSFFLLNKPVATYTIRFIDLMSAWRKLGIDNNFVILSMGVYLGTYIDLYGKDELFEFENGEGSFNEAKIISVRSSMRCFLIIPKELLPYVVHTKIEGGIHANGVKCIDEASSLYSNVDDLDADTNRILHVKRKVNIVHKKGFTKYVMLKVEYRTDSSTFDLEKIEDLKKFIATNNNI